MIYHDLPIKNCDFYGIYHDLPIKNVLIPLS